MHHINLLKPWVEREAHFISLAQQEEDFGPSVKPVSIKKIPMEKQLTTGQQEEVNT
ncbi:UNVERIFIED_CONTAM: hypothetical protein FKN15_012519 [Acipenser sinensis]